MLLKLMRRILRKNKASTADTTAAVRARHQRHKARLIDDPIAKELCGQLWQRALKFKPLGWLLDDFIMKPIQPVSMCVLMRARYAEQALEEAVKNGVRQYVIIGAGMDSFAFRNKEMMERIDVFEIDHPKTQEVKLRRIQQAELDAPERLHFLPADLSQKTAMEALNGSAFDPSQPAFLTLLGVSYYIAEEDLAKTARSIAERMGAGSFLLLDYMLDPSSSKAEHLPMREKLMTLTAGMGEPMVSEYSFEKMDALMARQGFETLENVNMTELAERYLEEVGWLPFAAPGIFGMGAFRTVEASE
ncbi:MAG: class I SAM-dependent methyltransferase [Candidatus Poribacteria bacterium]|nr:class I SAM-dependent methyltransferase [Candidatus Poribacteria bacterium]